MNTEQGIMNITQEQYDSLHERARRGGSFERALIEAYMKADGGNQKRLEEAFEGTMFNLKPRL